MDTPDVTLPTQRLPGHPTQPAATALCAAPGATNYPVPENLTPGGLRAFETEVATFAVALGAELARKEVEARSWGGPPEHTAEAVIKARQEYIGRLWSERSASGHKTRDRSVLAVILVTVAIVGLNLMQNFLHSRWQTAVLALFVLVGLAGLAVTWVGRVDWDAHQSAADAAHPLRATHGQQ